MRADFEVWECVSSEGPQTDPVWLMYDAETNTFPLDKIQERWKCWQASRESLVIDVDTAAKALAESMDYPWEFMQEQGRAQIRLNACKVIEAAAGLKVKS